MTISNRFVRPLPLLLLAAAALAGCSHGSSPGGYATATPAAYPQPAAPMRGPMICSDRLGAVVFTAPAVATVPTDE